MDDNLNSEVINKTVLARLKAFVDQNYGTYSAFASAMGMTTSTITSMFNRNSLPSGAILVGIKRLHPSFQLDSLFQDVVDAQNESSGKTSLLTNEQSTISEALIGFLRNNEIKLNITLNQSPTQ